MLRKNIPGCLLSPDAKESGGPSSPTAPASTGSSSNVPPKEPTFAEVAKAAYDKATAAEVGSQEGSEGHNVTLTEKEEDEHETQGEETHAEEQASDSEVEKGKEAVEKAETETEDKDKEKSETSDPDAQLPFHEHPRWKEVVAQRNEYEQKFKTAEAQVAEAKPKLDWLDNHVRFMQQFSITDQEFVTAMNVLALQKSDPARARELMEPMWKSLQEFSEDYLPPDIKKLVDDNEMTEAAAKLFAQERRRLSQVTKGSQFTAQQQERMREQQVGEMLSSWDRMKRKNDADFKPKAKPEDPNGLWELTAANYSMMSVSEPRMTPEKASALLEEAYKQAKATVTRFAAPRIPTPPRPTTSRSSSPVRKEEKDMSTDEVVASVAAKHGISWHGRRNNGD